MSKGWPWLLGAGVVLTLVALPAEGQVRVGVGVATPGVGVNVGVGPRVYVGRTYQPHYYRPVRVYRPRPYAVRVYDRFDNRTYRREMARAQREYRREVRDARREFARDLREARRGGRWR